MIHSLTIVCDEAGRYLDSMLQHTKHVVDDMFIFDDGSSDNSVEVGLRHCFAVSGIAESAFLVDEGDLRSTALSELARIVDLDWVLSIDADEFIVTTKEILAEIVDEAEGAGKNCVEFMIPEVFQLYPPMVRVDGFWGGIRGARLFKFEGDVRFKSGLACGSVPLSVSRQSTMTVGIDRACILHYGYANVEDRRVRFERYDGQSGHNKKHVDSIMSNPLLMEWKGVVPDVWRGHSI
jgi:hypothetical protein